MALADISVSVVSNELSIDYNGDAGFLVFLQVKTTRNEWLDAVITFHNTETSGVDRIKLHNGVATIDMQLASCYAGKTRQIQYTLSVNGLILPTRTLDIAFKNVTTIYHFYSDQDKPDLIIPITPLLKECSIVYMFGNKAMALDVSERTHSYLRIPFKNEDNGTSIVQLVANEGVKRCYILINEKKQLPTIKPFVYEQPNMQSIVQQQWQPLSEQQRQQYQAQQATQQAAQQAAQLAAQTAMRLQPQPVPQQSVSAPMPTRQPVTERDILVTLLKQYSNLYHHYTDSNRDLWLPLYYFVDEQSKIVVPCAITSDHKSVRVQTTIGSVISVVYPDIGVTMVLEPAQSNQDSVVSAHALTKYAISVNKKRSSDEEELNGNSVKRVK